jgi:hypothetical protein
MQIREISYLIQLKADKARQQLQQFDKSFDSIISKTGSLDSALQSFSNNSSLNLLKVRAGVDALKKSMNSLSAIKPIGQQQQQTAVKTSTMRKTAENSRAMALNVVGATKGTSRLNKQLQMTDRLTKSIRDNTQQIKGNLNSTRAPRVAGATPRMGGRGRSGSIASQNGGLAFSAQENPYQSALYRGLGMSTLLLFGGVGPGFVQMGVQMAVKAIMSAVQTTFKSAQEGADFRKGILEAGATSQTFLTNKAEEEGLNAIEVNKIAKANALSFAKSTVFTQRQALVAQAGLVEGGMSTGRATDMKTLSTILDRTIARYNKVNVSEQNIQTFINQLANASVTGKVGRLAFFRQEGQDWMDSFLKAKPEERWDMMLKAMEKSSDGLAETIANSDKVLTLSILQANRKESEFSGRLGRLGMEFETLKTSMITNMIKPMEIFVMVTNKLAREINHMGASDLQKREQLATRFGVSQEEMEKIRRLGTEREQSAEFKKAFSERIISGTDKLDSDKMKRILSSASVSSLGDRKQLEEQLLDRKIHLNTAMESRDLMTPEAYQHLQEEYNQIRVAINAIKTISEKRESGMDSTSALNETMKGMSDIMGKVKWDDFAMSLNKFILTFGYSGVDSAMYHGSNFINKKLGNGGN